MKLKGLYTLTKNLSVIPLDVFFNQTKRKIVIDLDENDQKNRVNISNFLAENNENKY